MLTSPDIAHDVVRADSVSTAMLLVLEALSPVGRAVFVLNEAFGYSHGEIARILGRSDAAVRQVAHRARQAVAARQRRYDTDPVTRQRAAERFRAACLDGQVDPLLEVLAPEVTMVSDGGGLTGAPRRPIHGAVAVARAVVVLSQLRPSGSRVEILPLNGGPGLVIYAGRTPVVAATLHLVDGMIASIQVVSNPEKLTGVSRSGGLSSP